MDLPSLFIFDMDGLIFDSEHLFMEFLKKVNAEYGYGLTREQYIRTIGRSRSDCAAIMAEQFGCEYPYWEISGIARERVNGYAREHAMPEKPGIRSLLHRIREAGIRCCIASSSPRATIEIYLREAHLTEYFDFIMSGEQLTHSKPDPEVFLLCLEHYGCAPGDAVVLEDSEPGIEAAFRAGIPIICIPDMKEPEERLQSRCLAVAEDAGCVEEFFFGAGDCGCCGCT